MRIALTGATGFVGRAVVARLEPRETVALVRNPQSLSGAAGSTLVQGDLQNIAALDALVKDVQTVVHIAGAVSAARVEDFRRINTEGTKNLLEASMRAGVRRFILISSLAARQPSLSPYAASKAAAEQHVASAARQMETLILRPAAVYGPGDTATLPLVQQLMSPIAVIPGRRQARFSMIHVDDLAEIIVEAAESPLTGTRELDDGEGGHSWQELAGITRQRFGSPVRVMFVPSALAMTVGHAADGLARVLGKPMMISASKMNELYHPDWVASPPGWPRGKTIGLAAGLTATIEGYTAKGWLKSRNRKVG